MTEKRRGKKSDDSEPEKVDTRAQWEKYEDSRPNPNFFDFKFSSAHYPAWMVIDRKNIKIPAGESPLSSLPAKPFTIPRHDTSTDLLKLHVCPKKSNYRTELVARWTRQQGVRDSVTKYTQAVFGAGVKDFQKITVNHLSVKEATTLLPDSPGTEEAPLWKLVMHGFKGGNLTSSKIFMADDFILDIPQKQITEYLKSAHTLTFLILAKPLL